MAYAFPEQPLSPILVELTDQVVVREEGEGGMGRICDGTSDSDGEEPGHGTQGGQGGRKEEEEEEEEEVEQGAEQGAEEKGCVGGDGNGGSRVTVRAWKVKIASVENVNTITVLVLLHSAG